MGGAGRVVVVGSLNVDLVARVERLPRAGETVPAAGLQRLAGGKGANQALAARAAGARVVLVGAVGQDEPGRAYAARLSDRGVDARLQLAPPGIPTGTAFVLVDEAGENCIVVVPGANDYATAELPDLRPGDVLLAQLEVPLGTVATAVRRAADLGARVVLNAAPYAALSADVVACADPLVVNEVEAAALADSGLVPGSLLVTFGAAGAQWDDLRVEATAVPDGEVVDTTGAGDAFCGALAAALAGGADRRVALDAAVAAGAAAVRRVGAQPDPAL